MGFRPVRVEIGGEAIPVGVDIRCAPLESDGNKFTTENKDKRTGYVLSYHCGQYTTIKREFRTHMPCSSDVAGLFIYLRVAFNQTGGFVIGLFYRPKNC